MVSFTESISIIQEILLVKKSKKPKILLAFSQQEIDTEMLKCYVAQWLVFTNNFFVYDLIFMYLHEYEDYVMVREPIFKGRYYSLYIYKH